MNDARVDHIEEALAGLDRKVDGLGADLRAEMKAGFDRSFKQTQGGFDDFQAFATSIRTEAAEQFKQLHRRLDGTDERIGRLDGRFDRMDTRFDRLEQLITGSARKPARPSDRKP